ncbi:MAG: EamA family transporter [Micropruina sp.]|nr:MAG: EamA family transporter [Micropruina sp.]
MIWVVVWGWVRSQRRPSNLTLAGMVVALAGLVVVIDPFGSLSLSPVGLAWGFVAGLGLAVYYVVSGEHEGLPPVAFVSFGLGIGTVGLLVAGVAGLVPWAATSGPVRLLGGSVPWWVPAAELVLLAAAAAYFLGFLGAQYLGSTLASFVGLTEVLFAVVWAWLFLAELPGPGQLLGGLVLLAGVTLVRWASARSDQVVAHDDLLASGADADA